MDTAKMTDDSDTKGSDVATLYAQLGCDLEARYRNIMTDDAASSACSAWPLMETLGVHRPVRER